MRALLAVAVLVVAAGCIGGPTDPDDDVPPDFAAAAKACESQPPREHRYWFGADHTLVPGDKPAAGSASGNALSSAFLTNDLKEWLSGPLAQGLHITGDVTLEFWAESAGTPAPIVIGGSVGEAYHFFNQFGSNRSFQPAFAVEYAAVLPAPDSVLHFNETLVLPPGGFVIERGDRVRVLLTDLVLDGPDGSGHAILFGGETPSSIRFTARCIWPRYYQHAGCSATGLRLIGNEGLLTGAIPSMEGINMATVGFTVDEDTKRIEIDLRQTMGATIPKQDVDAEILDSAGNVVWSVGSPYTDEHGVIYEANLVALMPAGDYAVRVHSYSGTYYEGTLKVCDYGGQASYSRLASSESARDLSA